MDVNQINSVNKETALLVVIRNEDIGAIRLLLKAKAKVYLADSFNWNALHYAAFHSSEEILEVWLTLMRRLKK